MTFKSFEKSLDFPDEACSECSQGKASLHIYCYMSLGQRCSVCIKHKCASYGMGGTLGRIGNCKELFGQVFGYDA